MLHACHFLVRNSERVDDEGRGEAATFHGQRAKVKGEIVESERR